MSYQPYDTRSTVRALTGLDIGLKVRIEVRSPQRVIVSGTPNHAVQPLISDLAEIVGALRVHSYALRGQLEQAMTALQLNAEGGSWRYAQRAALDLADLLSQAGKRRLASRRRTYRAAEAALHVADVLAREVR